MTAHMAFPVPTATHDVRVPCGRCGTWVWAGDAHECAVPGPTNADVVDAAFPAHDRMLTAEADAAAHDLIEHYRARIEQENAYWAELYGVALIGTGKAA